MTDPLLKTARRIQKVLGLFGLKLGREATDECFGTYRCVCGKEGGCVGVHVYVEGFLDDIIIGRGDAAFESLVHALYFKFEQAMKQNDYLCNVYGEEGEVIEL